ncbi:protein of unknown function DUF477 [Methylocella silvestris BL2]|uniref:TPM domain-containing protein n=1 Tax=Methylocella silvestris (strain DSM 15510 / CIP 108128 / LMG 27833 / NCIMB 13906 / BL2) TaxID=395965 RepID=B8EPJ5_METSB|nr:TPM domain-containing protein [Methylocella silvestris]ACK50200.1 protein of unknown function DUF477 [Methylocella silvestris BL2]
MILSRDDQRRINAAITAAERQTSGEIVCVLARSSSDYLAYAVAWSALIALAVPWALIATTEFSVQRILLIQTVVFAALYLIFSIARLRPLLAPRALRRQHAHRAALEQFVTRGLARRDNHAGVLIFVSLAEHYVRVVADDGIAAKVDKAVWQSAVDQLLQAIREGDLAAGFIKATEQCGAVLAEHFPAAESGANLPDRIYEI